MCPVLKMGEQAEARQPWCSCKHRKFMDQLEICNNVARNARFWRIVGKEHCPAILVQNRRGGAPAGRRQYPVSLATISGNMGPSMDRMNFTGQATAEVVLARC